MPPNIARILSPLSWCASAEHSMVVALIRKRTVLFQTLPQPQQHERAHSVCSPGNPPKPCACFICIVLTDCYLKSLSDTKKLLVNKHRYIQIWHWQTVYMFLPKNKQKITYLQPVSSHSVAEVRGYTCSGDIYLNTHLFPVPPLSTKPQNQQNTACIILNILYFSEYKTSVQTHLSVTDVWS